MNRFLAALAVACRGLLALADIATAHTQSAFSEARQRKSTGPF